MNRAFKIRVRTCESSWRDGIDFIVVAETIFDACVRALSVLDEINDHNAKKSPQDRYEIKPRIDEVKELYEIHGDFAFDRLPELPGAWVKAAVERVKQQQES